MSLQHSHSLLSAFIFSQQSAFGAGAGVAWAWATAGIAIDNAIAVRSFVMINLREIRALNRFHARRGGGVGSSDRNSWWNWSGAGRCRSKAKSSGAAAGCKAAEMAVHIAAQHALGA